VTEEQEREDPRRLVAEEQRIVESKFCLTLASSAMHHMYDIAQRARPRAVCCAPKYACSEMLNLGQNVQHEQQALRELALGACLYA
jgi:hypothetical protein